MPATDTFSLCAVCHDHRLAAPYLNRLRDHSRQIDVHVWREIRFIELGIIPPQYGPVEMLRADVCSA